MKLNEVKSQFVAEAVEVSEKQHLKWLEEGKNIKPISLEDHIKEIDMMMEEMEKEGEILSEDIS